MQEIINRVISDFNKRISTKIKAEQKTEDPVYKFGFHSGAEAFKEARLIIEQIVQEYDMGWIPVSERLPNVQDISDNMCPCFLTTEKYQSTAQRRTFNIISGEFRDGTGRKTEVLAWMPLPKLYSNEEN